jgi:hypothetical protein
MPFIDFIPGVVQPLARMRNPVGIVRDECVIPLDEKTRFNEVLEPSRDYGA